MAFSTAASTLAEVPAFDKRDRPVAPECQGIRPSPTCLRGCHSGADACIRPSHYASSSRASICALVTACPWAWLLKNA